MNVAFESNCLTGSNLTGIGQYAKQLFGALSPILKQQNGSLKPMIKISRFGKKKQVETLLQSKVGLFHPNFNLGLGGFDLFHGPDFRVPFVKNLAKVVTIHDLCEFEDEFHPKAFTQKGIAAMKNIISKADPHFFIADSEFTRKRLEHYFPQTINRTAVVHLGADHLKTSSKAVGAPLFKHKYILYVGAIEKRKNTQFLIESFKNSNLGQRGYHLILIGKIGFEGEEILKNLTDNIHYYGFVDNQKLIEYYAQAEFFVFPSLYEGFGFPILEAMNFGVPVITSNTTACKETASDAALLIDPKDSKSLIEALEILSSSADLRSHYKNMGLKRAKEFTWSQCAFQTLDAYDETLALFRSLQKTYM